MLNTCPKHVICQCILKDSMYRKGFKDALRKAATILTGSPLNPRYRDLLIEDVIRQIARDILELKEDPRD